MNRPVFVKPHEQNVMKWVQSTCGRCDLCHCDPDNPISRLFEVFCQLDLSISQLGQLRIVVVFTAS